MTYSLPDAVAAEIRAEMARRHLLHDDIAQVLGISRPGVGMRLNGRTPFRLSEIERLAEYFDVPVSALIRERVA